MQDTASLGDYSAVPDYVFHQNNKKDIKLLKNSINDVILKRNKIALAHHLTLELKIVIGWMKKYFTTYVIPKYLYLPMDRRNAYIEENQSEKIKECCICRFKINDASDKDLLKFIFKKEYVCLLEKIENIRDIFDDNTPPDAATMKADNYTHIFRYEEFFIKKMMCAYKEVQKLDQIDYLRTMKYDNVSDIKKINEELHEKLLSKGFTSLSSCCEEVEIVTVEIAEDFLVKLIYYEFWQELGEKLHFLYFLSIKSESGKVKIGSFITTIILVQYMDLLIKIAIKNYVRLYVITRRLFLHITVSILI